MADYVKVSSRISVRCMCCPHAVVDSDADGNVLVDCNARCHHIEPPQECARDEAVLWLASSYAGDDHEVALAWLIGWAQRRNANLVQRVAEFLVDIADGGAADAGIAHRYAAELIGLDGIAEYLTNGRPARASVSPTE